ncbi:CPBP family intramembrane glutamic endopeptidase [Pseudomonas fluorescens]|uniref:CPBP family intramembrane glutamic endopeptidase n=1 Tax=Pseudomonas fluorescens TaxID=294 RepID=UPI0012532242|nr:CPBP family intramembrane glutamic endopeptidase [Pseudomonas fluorescens]VVO38498.1 hypothetical protein PS720_05586 [Pseudomonas fluorescens]
MNTITPEMSKGERLALLYKVLKGKPALKSPAEVRQTVSDELALIEQDHAPAGSRKMTILPLDDWMVQPYGSGGVFIPQINADVRINANGAFGIFNAMAGRYELQKAGADGHPFFEIPDWKYDYSVTKPEKQSSVPPAEVIRQPEESTPELLPQDSFTNLSFEQLTQVDKLESEVVCQTSQFRLWRSLLFAFLALVLFLVMQSVGRGVIPEESLGYLWVLGQHGLAALGLGGLLAVSAKSLISLWGAPNRKIIALVFFAVTAAYVVDAGYTFAMGTPQEPWMAQLLFGLNGLQTSVLIATLLIFPPVTEELLFRYFFVELMPYGRSKGWAVATVVATSLAFAAMHAIQYQSWSTLVLMFSVGAIFATARIVSRGLGLPLLLHSYAVMLGLGFNWLMN